MAAISNNLLNPYVYLHTHVKIDGSVMLGIGAGTAGKFAQVSEDCRALRANPKEAFEQFVERASTHISLETMCNYSSQIDGTVKTHLAIRCDPFPSPQVSALLTDEYERQLQWIDSPRLSLRQVKRISIIQYSQTVHLERSDDVTDYRHSRTGSNPALLKAILDLRVSFETPEKTAEIRQKITKLIHSVLTYTYSLEYQMLLSCRQFHIVNGSAFERFFLGTTWSKLAESDSGETTSRARDVNMFKVVNTGFVDRHIKEGKELFMLNIQFVTIDPSLAGEKMQQVLPMEKIPAVFSGAMSTITRNLGAYTHVNFKSLLERSYTRPPEIQATPSKLVQLLEPEMVLWQFAKKNAHERISTRLEHMAANLKKETLEDATIETLHRLRRDLLIGLLHAISDPTQEQKSSSENKTGT